MIPTHPDLAYPDPDLVRGYIVRRGVATFHTADPTDPTSGLSPCGKTLADLIDAGWARGLRRRGAALCSKCAGTVDLDGPTDLNGPTEDDE